MDAGLFAFVKELRSSLIKESGIGSWESVSYGQAVDFVKKQFKGNPDLATKILDSLFLNLTGA